MVVLQNEQKYFNARDKSERLHKHSIISQHAISNAVRSDWVRMISITEIEYGLIPWGINLDQESQEYFAILEHPQRILPYKNNWQCAITFEYWTTLTMIERVDYGFLDWASDVGGLYDFIRIGLSLILSLLISNGPSMFVGTQLMTRSNVTMKQSMDSSSLYSSVQR